MRFGMFGVPTFFDATHPPVLDGQPHHADDEPGRSNRCEHNAGVVVTGREGGQDPTKHTSAKPMTISAGMFLVSVIDSPA